MSTMEQVEDNLNTFAEEKPLNPQELKTLLDIADSMTDQRPLHRLPVLHHPLPPGAGYPHAA